jgi:dephospho-CoA kinase
VGQPRTSLKIGLTGGIASGKSTVAGYFAALGACVVDADKIAHGIIEPGGAAFDPVVERFGPEILDTAGSIDRARLGEIVFGDPDGLAALNAIVHPEVRAESNRRIAECAARPETQLIIYDAALLVETGVHRDFDKLVVTYCSNEAQRSRVMRRDGLSEARAEARIAAQLPVEDKVDLADYVVDTEESRDRVQERVAEIYELLTAELS